MRAILRIILTLAVAVLVSSCGGQDGLVLSGSGESGIGGTGISYVKGNVSAINGDGVSGSTSTDDTGYSKSSITGTTVSGGGRTAMVQQDGSFILDNVMPQAHMVLSFRNSEGMVSTLDIGNVGVGQVSLVSDISIDYISGKARARTIQVIENNPGNTPGQGSGIPPATGNSEAGQSGNGAWTSGKDGPCGYDPGHSRGCSEGNRNDGGNSQNNNGQNNGNNGNGNNGNGNNGNNNNNGNNS